MIRLTGVNKIHDAAGPNRFQSLYDIDLHVAAGELAVLQGVSGSGKTTLLSIVGALMRPSSGEVLVDGQPVAKLSDRYASAFRRQTVGFLFQGHHLFSELSVEDNVAMPLVATGAAPGEITAGVKQALALAGLGARAGQTVRTLSGGEKQRCSIARALVNDPRLILCDEPTANLDQDSRADLLQALEDLKRRGRTVLIATHDPIFDSLACVDRVLQLQDGRIRQP
jgi:putative ABC transport system ATP-binding protein